MPFNYVKRVYSIYTQVAGCQLSTSFARGLLWELLDRLSNVDPEYPCGSQVDDLSHVLVAETAPELKLKLLKAGRYVGSGVIRFRRRA